MALIYVYTLPTNLAISLEQSLSAYAFHRKQVFLCWLLSYFYYIFDDSCITPWLDNDSHVDACKLMYAKKVNVCNMNPLKCIVF